jgi:hypothetical protein
MRLVALNSLAQSGYDNHSLCCVHQGGTHDCIIFRDPLTESFLLIHFLRHSGEFVSEKKRDTSIPVIVSVIVIPMMVPLPLLPFVPSDIRLRDGNSGSGLRHNKRVRIVGIRDQCKRESHLPL